MRLKRFQEPGMLRMSKSETALPFVTSRHAFYGPRLQEMRLNGVTVANRYSGVYPK